MAPAPTDHTAPMPPPPTGSHAGAGVGTRGADVSRRCRSSTKHISSPRRCWMADLQTCVRKRAYVREYCA
jgi:hypothetical protein